MARKKKALPQLSKISVNLPELADLAVAVGFLDQNVTEGLGELNDTTETNLQKVDATLVTQSNILEKGFGQNQKLGGRLLALQERLAEEEERRRVADEEAAMERTNQGNLLDVQKTLEEIKELLEKDKAAKAADAARKDGGIMSSLANLLGIGAAAAAAKGVLSRIPGVNRIPGLGTPPATPTGAPPPVGRAPTPVPGAPGTTGAPGVPPPAGKPPVPGAPPPAGTPSTATPVGKPPVTSGPAPMTPEQKMKYEELRKQGVPAAEAKAQATTKPGFEGYADKEKKIMEAAGKKVPPPPGPAPVGTVPTPPPATTVPPAAPTPAPGAPVATEAAKKGVLGRAASIGGKAVRFIPGIGWAIAGGAALYETGEAAYNAEETLGIQGRKATTGERVAAGLGGLTSAATFGLISTQSAGRFFQGVGEGLTGAPAPTKPLPSTVPKPPEPAPGGTNQAQAVEAPAATRGIQAKGVVGSPLGGGEPGKIVEVKEVGPGYNIVKLDDGSVVRREGAFNWRNNNPGNIEDGPFAKSLGALPIPGPKSPASRYAIFPTYESGRAAKAQLLFMGKNYKNLPVKDAVYRWAPPSENNSEAYAQSVIAAVGGNIPLSQLSQQQRDAMLNTMEKVEGFKKGKITTISGPSSATAAPAPVAAAAPAATPAAAPPTVTPAAAPPAPAPAATPSAAPVQRPPSTPAAPAVAAAVGTGLATGAVMQASPGQGAAVQTMSERVQTATPPAPIVVTTPSVDGQGGGKGKPGSSGIPEPYANRGSLIMNTTFIAAA